MILGGSRVRQWISRAGGKEVGLKTGPGFGFGENHDTRRTTQVAPNVQEFTSICHSQPFEAWDLVGEDYWHVASILPTDSPLRKKVHGRGTFASTWLAILPTFCV